MSETELTLQDRIDILFENAQRGDESIQELSRDCLNHFRRDCQAALNWQKSVGRGAVVEGADPGRIREQAEQRVEEARKVLHARLTRLLDWGKETGRLPQETTSTYPEENDP